MRPQFNPRRFELTVARFRAQEAGRATTAVIAVLAPAALRGLAMTFMQTDAPRTIEQAGERAVDASRRAGSTKYFLL